MLISPNFLQSSVSLVAIGSEQSPSQKPEP